MGNVDTCVCCGAIVPEGTMVCKACMDERAGTCKKMYTTGYVESILGVRLTWYQKLFVKLYAISFKIPRKGLYKNF